MEDDGRKKGEGGIGDMETGSKGERGGEKFPVVQKGCKITRRFITGVEMEITWSVPLCPSASSPFLQFTNI